jgi:hypothetical protein
MAQRQAIFIGYRREDTADVAGRIFDALARRFGRARLFKDVDNLRPGTHFGDYIRSVLPRCRVFLALVGPHWLHARDERGERRLDDPNDWVRVEIETALATPGLTVVPVLVNGARMPQEEEVPESLYGLLRLHAATVRRDPDFHDDVRRMSEAIKTSMRSGALDLTALGAGVTKTERSGSGAPPNVGFAVALATGLATLAVLVFPMITRVWPAKSPTRAMQPEARPSTEGVAIRDPVQGLIGRWSGPGIVEDALAIAESIDV